MGLAVVPEIRQARAGIAVMGRTLRVGNWLDSKIPPMLGVGYVLILVLGIPATQALVGLAALSVSAIALAGYAHVLNDLFDIEADRKAGKDNRVARLPRWQRAALLTGLAALGGLPWLAVALAPMAAAVLAVIYVLPILYAMPPIRLKERGIWGAVADATLAHACPVLFVVALFADPTAPNAQVPLGVAILAGIWAICLGLRGILLHQIWDREHDIRSGISTFVVGIGATRARALILRYLFPGEIVAFGGLALAVGFKAPILAAGVLLVAGLDLIQQTFEWTPPFDPAPARPGMNIPPHDLYEVWFPSLAVTLLAVRDIRFIPVLILHVALFQAGLQARAHELVSIIFLLPGHSRMMVWRAGRACGRWGWK